MGQKTHPIGLRLGIVKTWDSRWFAKRNYPELLKEDLRMRRALELIAEGAKPIPMEQAHAREEIWTPEKEREEKGALWTPGSD